MDGLKENNGLLFDRTVLHLHPISDLLFGELHVATSTLARTTKSRFGDEWGQWPYPLGQICALWRILRWHTGSGDSVPWNEELPKAGLPIPRQLSNILADLERWKRSDPGIYQAGAAWLRALDRYHASSASPLLEQVARLHADGSPAVIVVRHSDLKRSIKMFGGLESADISTIGEIRKNEKGRTTRRWILVGDPGTKMLDALKEESGRVVGADLRGVIHWVGWDWGSRRVRRQTNLADKMRAIEVPSHPTIHGPCMLEIVEHPTVGTHAQAATRVHCAPGALAFPDIRLPDDGRLDLEAMLETRSGRHLPQMAVAGEATTDAVRISLDSRKEVFFDVGVSNGDDEAGGFHCYIIAQGSEMSDSDIVTEIDDYKEIVPGDWLVVWGDGREYLVERTMQGLRESENGGSIVDAMRAWKTGLQVAIDGCGKHIVAARLKALGGNSIVGSSDCGNLLRWAYHPDSKPRDLENILAVARLLSDENGGKGSAEEMAGDFFRGVSLFRRHLKTQVRTQVRDELISAIKEEKEFFQGGGSFYRFSLHGGSAAVQLHRIARVDDNQGHFHRVSPQCLEILIPQREDADA